MIGASASRVADALGWTGRSAANGARHACGVLAEISATSRLLAQALWQATVGVARGRTRIRKQLGPMLAGVGVRSLPIVALVSLLMGAIMVLQLGEVMERYGQIQEVPGVVVLSMTRELGPLMTAIIMTARVGASFTAVISAMKLNEEVLALETMAIHPIGYLVSPRMVSLIVMLPCLTLLSFVLGTLGAAVVAGAFYGIPFGSFGATVYRYLGLGDLATGLLKAAVFGVLVSAICCYQGISARGGPMGLGRHTMVAVVTSIVVIVLSDAILTAFAVNYLL